jgi:hypothetical protein
MRSLWRILALQWLGGEGSEALTADSAVADILMMGEHDRATRMFDVQRQSGASHHAMMSPNQGHLPTSEPATEEEFQNDSSGRKV